MGVKYFHGGPSGLKEILPPNITGVLSCSDLETMGGSPPGPHRKDRIYIVTDRKFAEYFAAFSPHKEVSVYMVEPEGLEHDPDCKTPGFGFQALRADVLTEWPMRKGKREELIGA